MLESLFVYYSDRGLSQVNLAICYVTNEVLGHLWDRILKVDKGAKLFKTQLGTWTIRKLFLMIEK